MKKYELTDETMETSSGNILRRIRALTEIRTAMGTVQPGDLGGWVELEGNLAQDGSAWVSDDARVFGNARVSGSAWISGDARVFGNARVYGDARVSGNARVFGNAWVSGNALVSDDARVLGNARVSDITHVLTVGPIGSRNGTTTFMLDKEGTIFVKCGCFFGTIDKFDAAVNRKHGSSRHGRAYRAAIELARVQIDTTASKEGYYDALV